MSAFIRFVNLTQHLFKALREILKKLGSYFCINQEPLTKKNMPLSKLIEKVILNAEYFEMISKRFPKSYEDLQKELDTKSFNWYATIPESSIQTHLDSFFSHYGIEIIQYDFNHPITGRLFSRCDYFEINDLAITGKVFSGMPLLAENKESIIFFKYTQGFEVLEAKLQYLEKKPLGYSKFDFINKNNDNFIGFYQRMSKAS